MDWNHVDHLWIIVLFLSAVWSLILMATITCEWSIGEQVKQTHLHFGWPEGKYIFSKFPLLGELFLSFKIWLSKKTILKLF